MKKVGRSNSRCFATFCGPAGAAQSPPTRHGQHTRKFPVSPVFPTTHTTQLPISHTVRPLVRPLSRCHISTSSHHYRCTFCRERLLRQPLGRLAWLQALLPIRRFKCPHCFAGFRRPPEFFCLLPGLADALNRQGPNSNEAEHPRYGLSENTQLTGIWGLLVRFGRLFSAVERSLWFLVLLVLRVLTSPFGRRKRGRSRSDYSSHNPDVQSRESSGRSRRRRSSSSESHR